MLPAALNAPLIAVFHNLFLSTYFTQAAVYFGTS